MRFTLPSLLCGCRIMWFFFWSILIYSRSSINTMANIPDIDLERCCGRDIPEHYPG
jgi:hypothetical protein